MCFNTSYSNLNYNILPIIASQINESDELSQFENLKDIHQKTILHIPDLHNIVKEYLKPASTKMTTKEWRIHIIVENIENKNLINWPLAHFESCFIAAFKGVNDEKEDKNSDLDLLSILLKIAKIKKMDLNTFFSGEYIHDGESFKLNFLHLAVLEKKHSALQFMLESNLFNVNFSTCTLNFLKKYDKTPLHLATMNGDALAIRLLLNIEGIDPGVPDINGIKPFNGLLEKYHYDRDKYSGCVETFRKLLSEDVFFKICDGFTLLTACELGLIDIVTGIINSRYLTKEINYQKCSYGITPLFSAVRNQGNHLNIPIIIQALLNHPHIDVNMRSSYQTSRLTPLHLALKINNIFIMKYPIHLIKLIQVLKKLPGVGSKSAERFAFHLLNWPDLHLTEMASIIDGIRQHLHHCERCGCLGEKESCLFCDNPQRTQDTLCIIASPRDAFAIEGTREYKGLYHVLGSLISPMEGQGPEMLSIPRLRSRLIELKVQELIIALDSTLEGDATALYLKQELEPLNLKISRLAFGLPVGSSLDYIDGGTLARALSGRRHF